MQVTPVDALELGPLGAEGDRAFYVLDPADAVVETARAQGCSASSRAGMPRGVLACASPTGPRSRRRSTPGDPVETHNYASRPISGRRVDGALAAAVSEHLGKPVTLLARDPDVMGPGDYAVSLDVRRDRRRARARGSTAASPTRAASA